VRTIISWGPNIDQERQTVDEGEAQEEIQVARRSAPRRGPAEERNGQDNQRDNKLRRKIMLHGGARPGAGRPKGATGKKTKEIISAIEAAGIMPRDVMLHVMREHFNKGEYDAAVEVAAKVAPYVHPRLAASSGTLKRPSAMTDEERRETQQPRLRPPGSAAHARRGAGSLSGAFPPLKHEHRVEGAPAPGGAQQYLLDELDRIAERSVETSEK
jgi:hypothetical protein